MNVPLERKLSFIIKTNDRDIQKITSQYRQELLTLTKAESITIDPHAIKPQNSAAGANEYCEIFILMEGLIKCKWK